MSLADSLLEKRHNLLARLQRGREADRASRYWASLRTYHESNDDDPIAQRRSRFVADVLVPELGIRSLLEVGTNSGRNLGVAKQCHPGIRTKGIDVNPWAIEYARKRYPEVEFVHQDANAWREPAAAWDAVLTMSLLDHVPDGAAVTLARNMCDSARYIICMELWDGGDGERGLYKYSRDNRRLFESLGARTRRWELAPGQYNTAQSKLWLYVGETANGASRGAG